MVITVHCMTHAELLHHVGVTKIYMEGTNTGTALSRCLGRWSKKRKKEIKNPSNTDQNTAVKFVR